jgi:NAD(P) transhydrogenase
VFAHLGTKVTLVDQRRRLLRFVDEEIAEALSYGMRRMGVALRLGEEVASVEAQAGGVVTTLRSGKVVRSDLLVFAAGRQPCTQELNLESVGVATDETGRILVDEHHRTTAEGVYAAGDVIDHPSLASTSAEQGRLAACHAFGVRATSAPGLFPYGIFTIPEISMVGPTEDELTARGIPYEVGQAFHRDIARGQVMESHDGMLKLLFHRQTRELLAVHAIGDGACELIHVGQAVMSFGGTVEFSSTTSSTTPRWPSATRWPRSTA